MSSSSSRLGEMQRFNELAANWDHPEGPSEVAKALVRRCGVESHHSLLDVASGTGILLDVCKAYRIYPKKYIAIDISNKMLEQLQMKHPNAETLCLNYEEPVELSSKFDYVIIYNSIPHFFNLDMVFTNARNHLISGGRFLVAHSRTRAGLKEHHRSIGYIMDREPIPTDKVWIDLCEKYNFRIVTLSDEDFFYFECQI